MSEAQDDRFAGHDRETWQLVISKRIEQLDTLKTHTSSYIHSMSTWMIAQVFLANAGGLTIASEGVSRIALSSFAVGIFLAMLCALSAWGQAHTSFHILSHHSNPNALIGREHVPESGIGIEKWERRLFGATLVFGLLSLVAFSIGAYLRIWT